MEKLEIVEIDLLARDLTEPDFSSLTDTPDALEQERLGELSLFAAEPFSESISFEEDSLADCLDCPPGDPRPSQWRRICDGAGRKADRVLASLGKGVRNAARTALLGVHAILSAIIGLLRLPGRILAWLIVVPGRLMHWIAGLPWAAMLTVRRGFLFGAVGGFLIASSTIWAISGLPYLPGHPMEPVLMGSREIPNGRLTVPSELAWFFIQFPYVSDNAKVRIKNHHTFVVIDGSRKKEYVLTLGQKFRRVEIYSRETKEDEQVQIFTPGSKRTVWFRGTKVMGQSTVSDGNLWMWRGPLWNAVHLKIFGLADLWLDSPYKRYSCAGFVHKFLSDAGVVVPILDAWDIAKQPWVQVPIEEMEPGDIITIKALTASHRRFWHHSITHVGVYIGHGKFIHAATSSRKSDRSWVRIADVDDFRSRIDKVLRPPELL